MPIYRFGCDKCGKYTDEFRKIAGRDENLGTCCGEERSRWMMPVSVAVDIPAYISPVSGKLIEGRKQRHEDLRASGCRPWEGLEQEKKAASEAKAREDAKLEAVLEAGAHEVLNNMPLEKQRELTAIL